MKILKPKKIKDVIVFSNAVSLTIISFIIILGMTVYLLHREIEEETTELHRLMHTVMEKMDKVPFDDLKSEYSKFEYADKEYISLAVEEDSKIISLTDDFTKDYLNNFETDKLEFAFTKIFYRHIYTNSYGRKYFTIRNFEYKEHHELIYVMVTIFLVIALSVFIISKIVAEKVLNPLSRIIEQSKEMSRNSIEAQFMKDRDDEIGELIEVLNETFQKKEDIIKSQKKFSSDVSHELKTPLAIVKGYLDILKWGREDAALLDEAVENMDIEIRNIEKIINNIFLSSNLEKMNIRKEEINVRKFLNKLQNDYRLIEKGRLILKEGEDEIINADEHLLFEAVRGLIDNAFKYSGGNVELFSQKMDGKLQIIIRDYGNGIPEEEKEKVFDRYYQNKEARKGVGLGLSIIKEIIILNDGNIKFENRKDGMDAVLEFLIGVR